MKRKIKEVTIGNLSVDGMYGQYVPIIPNPEANMSLGWVENSDMTKNVGDVNDLFDLLIKEYLK